MAARNRWMFVGLAVVALANGGCLAVVAGAAAAGAGATGYAYVKGRYYRDYATNLDGAFAGIKAALVELKFPIVHEEKANGKASIDSHTADNTDIRLEFETLLSRIPAEGQVTRVSIRVGAFGDELLSARIFDQADLHFVPTGKTPPGAPAPPTLAPPPAPPMPTTAAPTTPSSVTPVAATAPPTVAATPVSRPFETVPPPLAPAASAK